MKEGGRVLSYDLSFNVSQWDSLIRELRKIIPTAHLLGYGHIGDGNLHLNISCKNNETLNDE